jgi:hypothetical protein
MTMCQETRLGDCPACGGDPQREVVTHYNALDGAPDGWIEYCDCCQGTGVAEIPVEPIEQDDLPPARDSSGVTEQGGKGR